MTSQMTMSRADGAGEAFGAGNERGWFPPFAKKWGTRRSTSTLCLLFWSVCTWFRMKCWPLHEAARLQFFALKE